MAAAEFKTKAGRVVDYKEKSSTAVAIADPGPASMLAVIANAAANPAVDVAKMKELLEMQRSIERGHQEREFNEALLAAQDEMPPVTKDKKGDRYRYASLEKVSKEIDNIARKYGFSQSFGTADSPLAGHYRVVCDLSHRGGVTRRYFLDLQADVGGSQGKANKNPVQAVGSTVSYGRRYIKVMMFDVVIVGEDTDARRSSRHDAIEVGDEDVTEIASAEDLEKVRKAIEFCGVPLAKVLAVYRIERLEDMPAAMVAKALTDCKNYVRPEPRQ